MNITLWVIASLLAVAFLAAGLMKLLQPTEKLVASGQGWAQDVSEGTVKLIGAAEVLAAAGLVLPAAVDLVPVLVPLAATGLVVLMIGAIITHARRKETQSIVVNAVLLILAAVVIWGRFGPHSF